MLNRREFLGSMTAAAVAIGAAKPLWPSPVLATHLHLRGNPDSNSEHIEGCGAARAVLLTAVQQEDRGMGLMEKYPGRFVLSTSAQDVPHYTGEGVFASGFKRFEAILKAYPKTKFIGHADEFWANIGADYAGDAAYPVGPVKPGGLSDRWLADYANLYADLSANSDNNALSRSPEFTAAFLARHQNKLMFGSDCNCLDGNGKAQPSDRSGARYAQRSRRAADRQVRRARHPGDRRKVGQRGGVPQDCLGEWNEAVEDCLGEAPI